MTELVDPTEIELIVGAPRHPDQHIGRAVSDEETVYILHSQRCKDSTEDLRLCPYSKALDQGIDVEDWAGYVDRPVFLVILSRGLFPVPIERQDPVLEYLDRLKEMSPSPSLSRALLALARQIAELESARRARAEKVRRG
ncbi:MAG: hypothetical protein WBC29_02050 [Candidatus Moraniibacteriota bacterium]